VPAADITPDDISVLVPFPYRDPDAPVPAEVTDPVMSLKQFIYARDRHISRGPCHREMLAGFATVEEAKGVQFDRESAFAARLAAFHSAPLG
jgi:hypothetical protein